MQLYFFILVGEIDFCPQSIPSIILERKLLLRLNGKSSFLILFLGKILYGEFLTQKKVSDNTDTFFIIKILI